MRCLRDGQWRETGEGGERPGVKDVGTQGPTWGAEDSGAESGVFRGDGGERRPCSGRTRMAECSSGEGGPLVPVSNSWPGPSPREPGVGQGPRVIGGTSPWSEMPPSAGLSWSLRLTPAPGPGTCGGGGWGVGEGPSCSGSSGTAAGDPQPCTTLGDSRPWTCHHKPAGPEAVRTGRLLSATRGLLHGRGCPPRCPSQAPVCAAGKRGFPYLRAHRRFPQDSRITALTSVPELCLPEAPPCPGSCCLHSCPWSTQGCSGDPACPAGGVSTSTGWVPDLNWRDQGGIFKPELHLQAKKQSSWCPHC